MSDPNTRAIQTGLNGLGYDPGPIDGIFGPLTGGAGEAWLAAGGAAAPTPSPVPAAMQPSTTSMIYQGAAQYPVHEIVVHCSATPADWKAGDGLAAQVAEIRRWHVQDRGWRDIGYHWLIGREGGVLAGRPEDQIGAGVAGHNRGVIHVCLLGGLGSAATDRFSQHFTTAQDAKLRAVLQGIGMRTQVTKISGHNEYAAKACPGFTVATWLKGAA